MLKNRDCNAVLGKQTCTD